MSKKNNKDLQDDNIISTMAGKWLFKCQVKFIYPMDETVINLAPTMSVYLL